MPVNPKGILHNTPNLPNSRKICQKLTDWSVIQSGSVVLYALCFVNFNADNNRIDPKIKYSTELEIYLKRLLPTNAPKIEPNAIETMNFCSDLTSASRCCFWYLNKPIIMVGIINSPPATPNILLKIPITIPAKNPRLILKMLGNCKLPILNRTYAFTPYIALMVRYAALTHPTDRGIA